MKHSVLSFMSFALVLLLLLSSFAVFPATAEDAEYTEEFLGNNDVPAATHLDPVNPNASREAKNLLAYLQTLGDTNRMVVGTFDISNTNKVYNDVKEQFDVECALYSARYAVSVEDNFKYEGNTYQTLDFYDVDMVNDLLVEHYNNGNILLVHSDTVLEEEAFEYIFETGMAADRAEADQMGFVSHFDATNPDRDMTLYQMVCTYNDNVIDALRRLEAKGVKAYMFRPWVEFNRFTFHGINQEQREVSRRVWQQTSDLFKQSGLEGFLLSWSGCVRWYENYYHYPGNEYCDIIAPTMYGKSSTEPGMGGWLDATRHVNHDWAVKTGKVLGFSEISCRQAEWSLAGYDGRQSWYQTLKSVINNYPETAFVNCWADGMYSLANTTDGQPANGNDDGYIFLHSPFSITLEDIPDYRTVQFDKPGVVQLYTEKNYGGNDRDTLTNNWIGLEEKTYTYDDLKALGLDPKDIASFHINSGLGVTFYATEDATGAGWSYLQGAADISKDACFGKIRSLKVIRPKLLSQDKNGIYGSDNDEEAWKANDGAGSRWKATVDEKGRGWLVLDLESPCVVGRWEVLHAGSAEEVDIYNTVDYCLQVSLNGKTWTTVDAVTGNTANRTNRTLTTSVEGQYFRLLITDPNRVTSGVDVGCITIADWKLYGLETGKAPQTADWDALLNPDYVDAPAEDIKTEEDPSDEEDSIPDEDAPDEDEKDDVDGDRDEERGEEDTLDDEVVSDDAGDETVSDDGDGAVDEESTSDDYATQEETFDDEDLSDEEVSEEDAPAADDETEDTPSKKKKVYLTTVVDWTWVIVLIAAAVVLVGGGILWIILAKRRRAAKAASEETA